MDYDNTNRGVLFKGEKKTENHPDYKGNINVNGQEFWLSAWIKTPNNGGDKYMSLSVQPKEQQAQPAPQQQPQQAPQAPASDDGIPF